MSKNLKILQRVDTLKNIKEACESGHHGFPVVNKAGNMIGIMPRNFIITILQEEGYYELHGNDAMFEMNKSRVPTNQNLDQIGD